MTVQECLKRWMLAYIDPPFFYLPFKSGEAGAYIRLVFADNLTANNIIVGVYNSNNKLIACSHYVTPQKVYVLNTDIVSRRSNIAYNFEMIEVPYLHTGYIADYTYRNKKYLLLPNGKYYVKVIRVGSIYVPKNRTNKYEFTINETETIKQIKEIEIPSLLDTEHIEVKAESRTECLRSTALIEHLYGSVEKTEEMDENTYRTVKWNSYITSHDVTDYNSEEIYQVRTYVDATYHLFTGNTDVGIIGRKRLNFAGHPLNWEIYTSEKSANDSLVELTRYYVQGTDDIVGYYTFNNGMYAHSQYNSGNGHSNVSVFMSYAVASSEIYNLLCDTSTQTVTLGYVNSAVTNLSQPNNTCTWDAYGVGSSYGYSSLRVYDTETESFLYRVTGTQDKSRYASLPYDDKIEELDHWFSQTFDELRVSINKIYAGEYYSPDFVSRHSEVGAIVSVRYDTNILRDITNDYTTTVQHTRSGTYDDKYYEFRFNNLQASPAYYWYSDYEPTQYVTATQACEYIQPIEWGEYDEIRFNLNNWNRFTIYKNFIRNYAIDDVPVNAE